MRNNSIKDADRASNECRLINLFHCYADNIGDRMCGPAQYFWPDKFEPSSFNRPVISPLPTILGGGQIFGQIATTLRRIEKRGISPSQMFAWGVGLPRKGRNDTKVREVSNQFSRFSTRNYEWKDELEFVPCASCMSPLFDRPAAVEHEIVLYLHRKKLPDIEKVSGIPTMTNAQTDPKVAIDFISSGETVVTNSYHGVYWAQLLGRKVVCIPYNEKFQTFQHSPTYAQPDDWMRNLKLAKWTNSLLEEYRALNSDFASGVNELLQPQSTS